jgi:hypothetical protein
MQPLRVKQFLLNHCPLPVWLRRVGLAGFLFFLIKGLLWLLVPAALWLLSRFE